MTKVRALLCLVSTALVSTMVSAGTTGTIRGVVIDAETLEPLGGVIVVGSSPVLQGEEVTLTDEAGRYLLTNLPPGTYTLRFTFAGVTGERAGIAVRVDQTIAVNTDLSSAAAVPEIYTIEEQAPSVDVASTTLGVNITRDFLENLPLGRSRNFEGALDVLPSASDDLYGTSVAGATSPENQYVIDGLNTTDPAFALSGSRLVLEFVEELDIKVGGYAPEFGRATGALVNAVTKSGSNEFHGTIFSYYRPGLFRAKRRQIQRNGESIAGERISDYYLNAGFEVGGPVIKDKLWFHAGYAPEITVSRLRRKIFARQPGPDTDGDGIADGPALDADSVPITRRVAHTDHDAQTVIHNFAGKLTHLIDEDNRQSLSLHGAPVLHKGAIFSSNTVNGDPNAFNYQSKGIDTQPSSMDGIYMYSGKFMDDKLEVEAWLGWHRDESIWGPQNKALNDVPLFIYEHPKNLRDAQSSGVDLPRECTDAYDFNRAGPDALEQIFGTRSRCVVEDYRANSTGFGQTELRDRWTERLAATHLFDFAGLHQIKYGIDFEQIQYYSRRFYTGYGYYQVRPHRGYARAVQFYRPEEGSNAPAAKSLLAVTGANNYGAFLQDSWNPMPSLTLNYGLRWEGQQFLGIVADRAVKDRRKSTEGKFGIWDNWAPRIGGAWDFLGDGRSKFFAHWGRYFESVPVDLANRGLGDEGIVLRYLDEAGDVTGMPCADAHGEPVDFHYATNPTEQCTEFSKIAFSGEDTLVAPGLQGQYSDETTVGVAVELLPTWVFGLTGIHKSLGQVIEDISTDGGNTYVLANPGRFSNQDLAEIDDRIAREADPHKRAGLIALREKATSINDFPQPTRHFWALQFSLDKKFSDNFLVRASYLLSWTVGNHPGLFSDHNGQLDPNVTSTYDLPDLMLNRDGRLPQDRRHRIKIDAFYKVDLEEMEFGIPVVITPGGALRLASGRPVEALGTHIYLGSNEVFMVERGGMGTLPWTWTVDLHLGVRYNLDADMGVELLVDAYNLFNRQEVVGVDQTYTEDEVFPLVGATAEDLPHARSLWGDPVRVSPNYRNATAYQNPQSIRMGVRFFF